jgi:hypothetical protein
MNELEKKIVINRIISHLNPVPENCVTELLQQSLPDLERILDKLATTREQENSEEATHAHAQEMIRQSKADHAWAYVLLKVSLNGRHLVECAANRNILEGMLQPTEDPSPAIYETILKQYSPKFSWAVPQRIKGAADREAEFVKVCHEGLFSLCDANRQMFKEGVALENWAGASQVELQRFQAEAAHARQKFLINQATPSELRAEAKFQSATERELFVKAEADRQHQYVLSQQQQSGQYQPLPATDENGNVIDSRYIKKLSTIDFPRFRAMVKRFGSGSVTQRLRGE